MSKRGGSIIGQASIIVSMIPHGNVIEWDIRTSSDDKSPLQLDIVIAAARDAADLAIRSLPTNGPGSPQS